jgi:hypothetical protein
MPKPKTVVVVIEVPVRLTLHMAGDVTTAEAKTLASAVLTRSIDTDVVVEVVDKLRQETGGRIVGHHAWNWKEESVRNARPFVSGDDCGYGCDAIGDDHDDSNHGINSEQGTAAAGPDDAGQD